MDSPSFPLFPNEFIDLVDLSLRSRRLLFKKVRICRDSERRPIIPNAHLLLVTTHLGSSPPLPNYIVSISVELPHAQTAQEHALLAEIFHATVKLKILKVIGSGVGWTDMLPVLCQSSVDLLSTVQLTHLELDSIMDLPANDLPLVASAPSSLLTLKGTVAPMTTIDTLLGPLPPSRAALKLNLDGLPQRQIGFLGHAKTMPFFKRSRCFRTILKILRAAA
ncbi:hypothetical protein FB451DRAFT_1391847 [Mycena latifolia]|nr:hypothetical protein FB451DRAFT_1391847 [Mycena latifolia]